MYYSSKFSKFKGVKHCFFSKNGGSSKGLYKSLNCGRGSNDNKKNIKKNLRFVSKVMNVKESDLILMYQTHSNKVVEINKKNFKKNIKADAIITKSNNFALGVVTADCAPILLFDYKKKIVGCIHAGWKGAFSEIIKKTIIKMRKNNIKNRIYACVGPCIGKDSYEVGSEFLNMFLKKSRKNGKYFLKKKYKIFFNLRKFVADKLKEENVFVDHVNYDTYAESNNFFSYRRSIELRQPDYGRCISVIKII